MAATGQRLAIRDEFPLTNDIKLAKQRIGQKFATTVDEKNAEATSTMDIVSYLLSDPRMFLENLKVESSCFGKGWLQCTDDRYDVLMQCRHVSSKTGSNLREAMMQLKSAVHCVERWVEENGNVCFGREYSFIEIKMS